MKLPEDGPKYGTKHVAVIKQTNVNNQIGLFVIVVLIARIPQIKICILLGHFALMWRIPLIAKY
jgi:hypothetical protein